MVKIRQNIVMKINKQTVFLNIICIISISIFVSLLALVKTQNSWLFTRDTATALKISTERNILYNYVFVIISYLGDTKTIIFLCFLFLILPNRKKIGFPLLFITVQSFILSIIFKAFVFRPRPIGFFLQENVLNYTFPNGPSFPSGHAQTATVFWLTLSILFAINYCSVIIEDLIVANATIFCFLTCFARVYLGVHFLSDVLAGVCLAIFIIGTNVLLYDWYKHNSKLSVLNKYKFSKKLYT